METVNRLTQQVASVAPIFGVSVASTGVTASVFIGFKPQATAEQQEAAHAVVAGFDWSAEAHAAWRDSLEPHLAALRDQATAAVADIESYLTIADAATAGQVRAEVKAIDQRQRGVIRALARAIQLLLQ